MQSGFDRLWISLSGFCFCGFGFEDVVVAPVNIKVEGLGGGCDEEAESDRGGEVAFAGGGDFGVVVFVVANFFAKGVNGFGIGVVAAVLEFGFVGD